MTGRTLAASGGLALIIAGTVLGFLPRDADGVGCGSAFLGSGSAYVSDLIGDTRGAQQACDDARATTRLPALILLPVGAVFLVGSALGRQSAPGTPPQSGYPADGA